MANANTSAGAQGPPPQLSPESAPLFSEGISLVLSRWSALQMAIKNEWGGRGSRALAEQLGSDIFAWFTQSKETLYIDDLENILDEGMLSLNAMIEDGSIEEVAERLMVMHEEFLEGNYESIIKLRETRPQAVAGSHIRQSVNGDNDDDDSTDDDDESSNMMVDTPESNSQSNSVNVQASEVRPSVAAEAEDGWTVVSSKRKGKRN
ncbi:pre-rrna-processing protein tsr2 [Citrus sinensis]|uniref:pre-rRNA-processing protein TSR2 isoform X1 n=1 Tax=Citrus sinensis TaxID=2711 RepID=UPI00218EC4FE|nr:pre-rRNA-processing protein TSR2 isoform X1 [Citrus sinensis]KAH9688331.1 pre-rrna-processing protein tsr2 [Citrus sinensis]